MKEAIESLDRLYRAAHGAILAKSNNKLFFTQEEFKLFYGEIMIQEMYKNAVLKELKNKPLNI